MKRPPEYFMKFKYFSSWNRLMYILLIAPSIHALTWLSLSGITPNFIVKSVLGPAEDRWGVPKTRVALPLTNLIQSAFAAVWGRAPLFPLVHLLPHLSFFYFSLSFNGFTYFLLLSTPSLSTRIVPFPFQAGGRSKRPNMGLVCCV